MNTIAIVQARFDSERLPGKVLMDIEDKPILEHIIDSLQKCNEISKIVVATTTKDNDDLIEELSKKLGIDVFRGSSDNVLERFYLCSKKFSGDLIVRITADNPLIDPKIVDKTINLIKESKCDYASNILHPTFPDGFSNCEVFTFKILKHLYDNYASDPASKEHVTIQIRKNPSHYFLKEILAPESLERPNWRLTIDYPEDLELIFYVFIKKTSN